MILVRPITNNWSRENGFMAGTIYPIGVEVTIPEIMRRYPGSPDNFILTLDAHREIESIDSISAYTVIKKLYGERNMHEYASDRALFKHHWQGRAVITFKTVAEAALFKLTLC